MDHYYGLYNPLCQLFMIGLSFVSIKAGDIIGPDEFCNDDVFHGQCAGNQVILMKTALYGRLRVGKCVKEDMGYLGCSTDVISDLHAACSGKSECTILVSDLYRKKPCRELTPYLQVTYECIHVQKASPTECQSSPSLLTRGQHGYISSYVAKKYGCGNSAHPWRIEVLPGQRVNVSVISYPTKAPHSASSQCKAIGHISESGHRNNITVCIRKGGQEHLYTSNGQDVLINIDVKSGKIEDSPGDFLLHFEVFGCSDLKVPRFGWYKREGDHAIVGSEGQDISWTLTCRENQWSGVIGNCTANNLTTVVIICLAIGFAILLVIAGAVIAWKWRQSTQQRPPAMALLQDEQKRMGTLPPLTADSSHYRSLIRPPGQQGIPPHSQTMPRPPQPQSIQGDQYGDWEDYSADWRFGTAPWNKACGQQAQPAMQPHMNA